MPVRRMSPGYKRNSDTIVTIRESLRNAPPPPPPPRRRTSVYGPFIFGILAAFATPIALHVTGILDLRMPSNREGSPTISASAERPAPAARQISICPPQFRRGGGGVTCVTDGDSGVEAGRAWRLTSSSGGVDAPEIGSPECSAERSAGERARNRLRNLMSGGYTMSVEGTDRHDRQLVVIELADGRDAGEVLIDEGLAQTWPNSSNPWC